MPLKAVDFLKFFFCLCVVVIHCGTLSGINSDAKYFITQGLLRLAVPFFFVASGYFLGTKIKGHPQKTDTAFKKYVKRLLVPLIVFSLVNILLETIKMIPYVSGPIIFKEIIRHIVFYPWGALWFIQACIIGVLLLYPFATTKILGKGVIISILLYSWALVCNNYFFVAQGTFLEPYIQAFMNLCISARNGVFVGFAYIAIGFFIAMRGIRVSNFFAFAIIVIYGLEIYFLKEKTSLDDSALYISQLLMVPVIFIKSLNITLNISNETSLMLRNFSVGVYLLHRPVISILDILGVDYVPRTIVVCAICTGICYLVRNENGIVKKILF